jgi:predicted nucleic acid-binding protein
MIAYLDSSVLLRVLLNQPKSLSEFSKLTRPITSKILRTECLRTLDRFRRANLLTEDEHLSVLKEFHECLDSVEWIGVSDRVLERAGSYFPLSLGTLDAIHLSSALLWKEQTSMDCKFLTHDLVLKKAASAAGFQVLG